MIISLLDFVDLSENRRSIRKFERWSGAILLRIYILELLCVYFWFNLLQLLPIQTRL